MSKKCLGEVDSLRARYEYLKTELALLGFKDADELEGNYKLDKILPGDICNQGYHVLGRVGNSLEKYKDPTVCALEGKKDSDQTIENFLKEIENDKLFMENQDELLYRIRSIYPDFGLNMQDKVSEEDWNQYSKILIETANLIKDFTIGSEKRNLTGVSEGTLQDIISEFIDSRDFAKACKIEDDFMAQEFEEFKKFAEILGYDDEMVKETSASVELAGLVRKTEQLSDKRKKYVRNYDKYNRFLESLNNKITIYPREGYKGKGRDDD